MSSNGTLHRARRKKDYELGVLTTHEPNGQVTNFSLDSLADDMYRALALDGLAARMSRPGANPTEVWAALQRGEMSKPRGPKSNGAAKPRVVKLSKTHEKFAEFLASEGVAPEVIQKLHEVSLRG